MGLIRNYVARVVRDELSNDASTEDTLKRIYAVDQALAETDFKGSGIVVNITGLPMNNAAALGEAVEWVSRTQLSVADI